eukprot:TRINITY_DN6262_c0_g1_i2.p1 TRINITY_DN6262_c0_g1~~TRINITY_DN6262_c0_g1_i2.p1  ORF type:complete len:396 (-),score=66.66 TRINITY_DN6262_c0_g1_i2:84-1271(-)
MAQYNFEEAKSSVNKAMARVRHAYFFETRARISLEQGELEASLRDYDQALDLCPEQPVYLQRRAALLCRLSIEAREAGRAAQADKLVHNANKDLAAAHKSTYPGWKVQDFTLGAPPEKHSMKYSPFLQHYQMAEAPQTIPELKNCIRELLRALAVPDAESFSQALWAEMDQNLGDSVTDAAERCWTSFLRSRQGREFCSYISEAVRFNPETVQIDIAKAAAVAPICKALNANLVTTLRKEGRCAFPTSGKTLRGSTLPNHLVGWFLAHRGKQIRIPNYFATADEDVPRISRNFMLRSTSPHPRCLWEVRFDPRGNPPHTDFDMRFACKNFNLIVKRVPDLQDERECLFVAYSVFTVLDVIPSSNPTAADTPHRIVLEAAADNREAREDLPLAPWC